jgi:Protein of unknown function (DUF1064)
MAKAIRWTKQEIDDWVKRRLARHAQPDGVLVATPPQVLAPKPSKYGNVRTLDGSDSKAESKRLSELRLMNEAGVIRGLCRQPEYVLIPKQVRECGELIERKLTYVGDFQYEEWTPKGWRLVVEDRKGVRTPGYIQKRKLLLAIHGIEIRET